MLAVERLREPRSHLKLLALAALLARNLHDHTEEHWLRLPAALKDATAHLEPDPIALCVGHAKARGKIGRALFHCAVDAAVEVIFGMQEAAKTAKRNRAGRRGEAQCGESRASEAKFAAHYVPETKPRAAAMQGRIHIVAKRLRGAKKRPVLAKLAQEQPEYAARGQ